MPLIEGESRTHEKGRHLFVKYHTSAMYNSGMYFIKRQHKGETR